MYTKITIYVLKSSTCHNYSIKKGQGKTESKRKTAAVADGQKMRSAVTTEQTNHSVSFQLGGEI